MAETWESRQYFLFQSGLPKLQQRAVSIFVCNCGIKKLHRRYIKAVIRAWELSNSRRKKRLQRQETGHVLSTNIYGVTLQRSSFRRFFTGTKGDCASFSSPSLTQKTQGKLNFCPKNGDNASKPPLGWGRRSSSTEAQVVGKQPAAREAKKLWKRGRWEGGEKEGFRIASRTRSTPPARRAAEDAPPVCLEKAASSL